ncbi:MAG: phosphoenolpyruvate synthase [Nanoarchaeota archaeon]
MKNIAWFKELSKEDVGLVGGKGANLGEMWNAKFPIPPGFVITAQAFKLFLEKTKIGDKIFSKLSNLDIQDTEKLYDTAEEVQDMIMEAEMPDEIKKDIIKAYDAMNIDVDVLKSVNRKALSFIKAGRDLPFVAVRSSATAEDLPTASFAGQQATFLNVKGNDNLIKAVQQCWASLYTARAIYYRVKNNFPHEKVLIAVIVQKMVNSEASGVAFSINPSTNEDNIVIEAGFGLGEAIVGGEVEPDNYIIDKNNFEIKNKKANYQKFMYVKDELYGRTIKKNLNEENGRKQKLTDAQIVQLAKIVKDIEDHYGNSQDIEFAVENGKLYIVQSRPITTIKKVEEAKKTEEIKGSVLLSGLGASPGVASGIVKIIDNVNDLWKIDKDSVLVTKMTSPDYVVAMQKARAIVTDEGGLTSHASIVSREMGIACVVGTGNATTLLKEGTTITVDGTHGKIYSGKAEVEEEKPEEYEFKETKTKIYMNLGEPEKIEKYKELFFDGIGLMRVEFMIASYIKKHPLKLIKDGKGHEYIDKFAEGISKVARAIHPKPIVVRFSDFKTNEYRDLEGGEKYEPHEDNPMIGWRGVSRYISDEYKEAFKLECRAIKKVREEGINNVYVMLPFVRTLTEVLECLSIMEAEGLVRSDDFKVWLMAEVPSMALITEEFAQLPIDGCSIGSNDLTQLILGVDRDSAILGKMGYFNERNEAVLMAIENIIKGFHKYGKTVSICGQAPSEYSEIVEFLVKNEIDSISVNPDVVNKTRSMVADVENKLL